jgi:hypothetical protein
MEMDEAHGVARWERALRWLLGLPPYTARRRNRWSQGADWPSGPSSSVKKLTRAPSSA